jgi:hypothetical protein
MSSVSASRAGAVNEPNKLELAALTTIVDALAWTKLDGDVGVGLLIAIGASAADELEDVAGIDPADFSEALRDWRVGIPDEGDGRTSRAPTAVEKGRARAFHKACRIKAELEWSTADVEAYEWQRSNASAAASAAHTAAVVAAGYAAGQPAKPAGLAHVVEVSEVADVTKTIETPMLDDDAIRAAFAEYERRMWIEPRPEQEPTADQLSALAHLLKSHCCYVDFSIWGPHGMRILKQMKVSGLVMSANGELMHHEFKGPPSVEHWLACWEVFMAGMIMLNACAPPFLLAYGALIAGYAKRYGSQCWALIYQVETRFRREYMERARRRASNELDAAIVNNTGIVGLFDPARPWEYVFRKSTGDSMEPSAARYWHTNLEEPCLLIVAGARRVDGFIDGDASVCASGSGHMATQGSPAFALHDVGVSNARQSVAASDRRPPAAAPPAKRRALEDTPAGVKANIVDGRFVTNRSGNTLCFSFNAGSCESSSKGNIVCPKDPSRRHSCSKCLSSAHGAHECSETQPPRANNGKQNRQKNKKGKGGGK